MEIINNDYSLDLSIRKCFLLLWKFFSRKNKISIFYLLLLNIIAGFSEFISLSLLIPFVHILDVSNGKYNHIFITCQ